jgi:alkyl sulfatase BDS1-like metallo-beta-lactamase superfamily hydrolase
LGFLSDTPDLTLTINRSDLERTMAGEKMLEDQIADGTASIEGDASILAQLASLMVDFDPLFEILPGTKTGRAEIAHADPYEAVPGKPIAE